jgi:hypothetical protein
MNEGCISQTGRLVYTVVIKQQVVINIKVMRWYEGTPIHLFERGKAFPPLGDPAGCHSHRHHSLN